MSNCLKNGIVSGLDQVAKMALNTVANIPTAQCKSSETSTGVAQEPGPDNDISTLTFPISSVALKGRYIPGTSSKYLIPSVSRSQFPLTRLHRTLRSKPRLDPIPDSPYLNLNVNPDEPVDVNRLIHEPQNSLTSGVPNGRVLEPFSESQTDNASYLDHTLTNQLQQTVSFRENDFLESQPSTDPRESHTFAINIPSRRNSTGQQEDGVASAQNLNSAFQTNLADGLPNQAGNTQTFLIPPRDLAASKSRSESALSSFNLSAEADLRRNSSDNGIYAPETLISSFPRRDSVWTAEVLSIEILVDYVMDPEELWGKTKKSKQRSQDDKNSVQLVIPSRNNMEPQAADSGEKIPKPGRTAEVGIVLPMVANSPTEEERNKEGDKKFDDVSNTDNALPEKVDSPTDPTESRGSDDLNLPPREHWENRFQFLLSTIGYAVDLSNVWRFPFLCYKNGGGAFLIPYFTTLIFGAMPVFFMEMCLGQFNRCGPTAVWEKMSPMFKGIGIASCFMAYIVAFYYNVIIGWSFFYLFASFTTKLPWTTCFNHFNSENCWQIDWETNMTSLGNPAQDEADGVTVVSSISGYTPPFNRTYNASSSVSSTMEYFERGMLELNHSTGLDNLGVVKWQLALCTLLTFTLLYFCLWKGVKSTGKVVYVTATLPYVIMTILLVRGVLLPGAGEGIRYFITPKIDRLRKPKVWIDAAVQIFFSVGSGFGTHIAYASYNKFHNDCKRDCIVTVIVNSFTSIFSGFVIFSYLGYMSLKTKKEIDKVATEGPGLVFIVYPEAIATLPGSVGWAVIFFFMLLALGLDSAFGGLESPLTGIRDELCQLMRYRYFREVLTFVIILSAFIFSIPCIMQGGMYVFTILDTFAAGTSIVFIVLCEVVAVSWFYGMPQFCADVQKMTGEKPNLYWRICWKFICPLLLTIIVISSIISYQPLTYRTSQSVYVYPFYANVIGWCIACSSMSLVPGYIIYRLIRNKGSCSQRLALAMSPQCEHEEIRTQHVVKRFQARHWLSI